MFPIVSHETGVQLLLSSQKINLFVSVLIQSVKPALTKFAAL